MKKITGIILAFAAIASCSTGGESYTIRLEMEETEGRWVKLNARVDREIVAVDSVRVEEGKEAILTGSLDGVETMYLTAEGMQGSIRLLMENAKYTIRGSFGDPEIETTGQAQTDLNRYQSMTRSFDDRLSVIVEQFYQAQEEENAAAADSLMNLYSEISEEKQSVDSVYVAENPGSFASVLILRSTFYGLGLEDFEAVMASLEEPVRQLEEYRYMDQILQSQKEVAVGMPFKDFGLETPEGEMLRVSEVHDGQVLLIDFWASWCGPCRRANPELVALYNEFNDRGFEILGVSLDSDRESWLQAIEDDNLTWSQISDVRGWESEGARLYGVPAIPHTVLVDRQGMIHSKKLHGEALRSAVESLL